MGSVSSTIFSIALMRLSDGVRFSYLNIASCARLASLAANCSICSGVCLPNLPSFDLVLSYTYSGVLRPISGIDTGARSTNAALPNALPTPLAKAGIDPMPIAKSRSGVTVFSA